MVEFSFEDWILKGPWLKLEQLSHLFVTLIVQIHIQFYTCGH